LSPVGAHPAGDKTGGDYRDGQAVGDGLGGACLVWGCEQGVFVVAVDVEVQLLHGQHLAEQPLVTNEVS